MCVAALAAAVVAAAVGLPGAAAVAASARVLLRPNGAPWYTEPLVVVADSLEALRDEVARRGGLEGIGSDWWLADHDGQHVAGWEAVLRLPAEQRSFSVVPAGRMFQWGPRKFGERWKVSIHGREPVELETVANSPRVFVIHGLFSEAESDFLLKRALERTGVNALMQSGIGFKTSGERDFLNTRTSASAFDTESPEAIELINRSFAALRIPYDYDKADGLQILRYQPGEAYINHTDWFDLNADGFEHNFDPTTPDGSNRWATVFYYLMPPPDGGQTVFPRATIEEGMRNTEFVSLGDNVSAREAALEAASVFFNGTDQWEYNLVNLCYSSLSVKPIRLGAALFYHQDPVTAKLQPEADHGACPSFGGTKWGANLWIWNRPRHLQARAAPTATLVNFRNRHSEPLAIEFSMDEGKSWTHFAAIGAGASNAAQTYAGHMWRLVTEGGRQTVREWTVPTDAAGQHEVESLAGTRQNEL